MRIDDIAEIDASTSSEINSKFTMYLREGDSEKRREQFYCKELGKVFFYLIAHIYRNIIEGSSLSRTIVLSQDLRWRNYGMDIR